MTREDIYTLEVGKAGERRLEILNAVYNPQSVRLLKEGGLKQGSCVLDMGCGTGLLSHEMAKIVGENGSVLGIDQSEQQLKLARAKSRKNEKFCSCSAYELKSLDQKFDLIYCRFLLCHLLDPKAVLSDAFSCLNPGGVVVLEEMTGTSSLSSNIPSPTFKQWIGGLEQVQQMQKSDFSIGEKLPTLLHEIGFTVEIAKMFQPMLITPYEKELLRLGIVEIVPKFLEMGCYNKDQLDSAISELKGLENDKSFIPTFLRIAQIVARK